MGWLSMIMKNLFSSVIESIVAYFEKEKAEAAKWEAKARNKQLESIKKGKAVEKQIKTVIESAKSKDLSVSSWNSKLLLLCFIPFLTGCIRFYVSAETYRPVPPKIDRPNLPEDVDNDGNPDDLNSREKILMNYAYQLEAGYNAIREENKKHNEKAGFPVSD